MATLDMVLDSGFTVEQVMVQDIGSPPDNGTLTYNFPFPQGASGTYVQTAPPPFPPTSEFPGAVALTATAVSGNVCTGSNNVGATINIDPTKPASTYEAILGCESFNGLNDGPTAPSSITVGYQLGTITNGNTVTVVEAELLATTWGPAGTANSVESSAPEPSPFWLSACQRSAES